MPYNHDQLLETCKAIAASKHVTQYVIGVTTNPSQRRASYAGWARREGGNLDGFVILDWGLNRNQVEAVERHLFQGLVNDDKYGVIKMHYHPSIKDVDDQSVYIAWWSPWLVIAEEFKD
ncbi:hypothetical protein SAMN06297144_1864 [Sphingomonas guangdongensis]|uniref:Uncharacterized protein n=1 Tax=Sphingomonas guangdongensis TaxID=1141890 RepID=A0A285QXQ8_9SPHN|nr:hypothetical protein [Sphingomonas guangdongensis]SOB86755.1 hypothetical protein SAMN06297144_1864 [Sphingomonas guangdongensis]